MGRKDDILNSKMEVQSKGLYVQIVWGNECKVLVLTSLVHVHLASFANDYGIFSFQNYTNSNFQMFLHLFKWEAWKIFELMHFLFHFFLNWFSSRVKNLNVRLDFFFNYVNEKILIIHFYV